MLAWEQLYPGMAEWPGGSDGGGVSPIDVDAVYRAQETRHARGWYESITRDSFG